MDIKQINIGACDVTFKNVALGATKGGVEVTYEPKYKEVTIDQFGETPIDYALIGESLKIKANIAEGTFANLATVIPTADLTTGSKGSKLAIGSEAGKMLSDYAGILLLHPRAMGVDTSKDITITLAVVTGSAKLTYKVDEQQVIEAEFTAIMDTTTNRFGYMGVAQIS